MMTASNFVQIFDTTLRDGEQSPGATMNVEDKLIIARQLEKLGVDVIEAGFAAASEGDAESVRGVTEVVSAPIVLSLARTRQGDIEAALRGVPILFLTARDAPADVMQGFAAGATQYVTKPFKLADVVERVSRLASRGAAGSTR